MQEILVIASIAIAGLFLLKKLRRESKGESSCNKCSGKKVNS